MTASTFPQKVLRFALQSKSAHGIIDMVKSKPQTKPRPARDDFVMTIDSEDEGMDLEAHDQHQQHRDGTGGDRQQEQGAVDGFDVFQEIPPLVSSDLCVRTAKRSI